MIFTGSALGEMIAALRIPGCGDSSEAGRYTDLSHLFPEQLLSRDPTKGNHQWPASRQAAYDRRVVHASVTRKLNRNIESISA